MYYTSGDGEWSDRWARARVKVSCLVWCTGDRVMIRFKVWL